MNKALCSYSLGDPLIKIPPPQYPPWLAAQCYTFYSWERSEVYRWSKRDLCQKTNYEQIHRLQETHTPVYHDDKEKKNTSSTQDKSPLDGA